MIPAQDIKDFKTSLNDQLISFPVIKVSGQEKPFLNPVKVELDYSTVDVAAVDEEFLPVGKKLLLSSKYGVLLRNHKDSLGEQTWRSITDDRSARIERTQKDRLRISFSVMHFCK